MPNPTSIETFPPSDSSIGPDGPEESRGFIVYAKTAVGARQIVRDNHNAYRGAVYQDIQGGYPDSFLICLRMTTRALTQVPANGTGLWQVDAFYGYPSMVRSQPPIVADLKPRYWIEASEESTPVDTDYDGNPIVNAAGEPIDPPITATIIRETLVAEWQKYDTSWMAVYASKRPYVNKLNDDTYEGAPRGCLRCKPFVIEEISIGISTGAKLFKIQSRVEFREPKLLDGNGELPGGYYPGWHDVYPNRGFRVKQAPTPTDPAGFKQITLPTDVGDRGRPRFGCLIDPAGLNFLPNTAEPNYREALNYGFVDFNGIIS